MHIICRWVQLSWWFHHKNSSFNISIFFSCVDVLIFVCACSAGEVKCCQKQFPQFCVVLKCEIAWLNFYFYAFYFSLSLIFEDTWWKKIPRTFTYPPAFKKKERVHKVVSCGSEQRSKKMRDTKWDLWNCTVNVVNNSYKHHCENWRCLVKCSHTTPPCVMCFCSPLTE